MILTFSLYTSISLHSNDTELVEDISTYEVEVTESSYYDTHDTPGYTEYFYNVKGEVDGHTEAMLIKAAEAYIDEHGYEEPYDFDDND